MLRLKIYSLLQFLLIRIFWPKVKIWRSSKTPGVFSQGGQDVILYDYLKKSQLLEMGVGICEIGANDPVVFSNSFLLECFGGVDTFAFDPLPNLSSKWIEKRPKAVFRNVAVGVGVDGKLPFHVEDSDDMESSVVFDQFTSSGTPADGTSAYVDSISPKEAFASVFDYGFKLLFVDVEGYELRLLGDGIDELKIFDLILIENNAVNGFADRRLRKLICDEGFELVGRFGSLDDLFIRADSVGYERWIEYSGVRF